jgi:hypothetical protein
MQARGILPAAVLPVNTRWLDLIADSVKLEEYRLDTEYWQKRLLKKGEKEGTCGTYVLRAGYSRDSKALLIDAVPIRRRGGKPAWGAQDEPYIVLRIKSAWVFDKDGSVRILWAIKDNVLKIFGRY